LNYGPRGKDEYLKTHEETDLPDIILRDVTGLPDMILTDLTGLRESNPRKFLLRIFCLWGWQKKTMPTKFIANMFIVMTM
jgi:hypothetical protein